ncbi:MAG: hypothetical protein GY760_26485 [Deltaproteobacteria bacterium]|nr:hypothetical protein [Deltaproteobacteria bacterium]
MRQTEIKLTYSYKEKKKDISKDITKYLMSFTYMDAASGSKDDLNIKLEDRYGLWKGDWLPSKGAELEAEINFENKVLKCGKFTLDDISFSGPPDVVSLKAITSVGGTSVEGTKKQKTRENITLEALLKEIAEKNGLQFYYDCDKAINLEKTKQAEETDLGYLKRLCDETGLKMKISNKMVIIFEAKKADRANSKFTLEKGKSNIISYSFNTKLHEIYKSCKVKYQEVGSKDFKEFTYTPDNPPESGKILVKKRLVKSIAETEDAAKSELRMANQNEVTGNLSVVGDPLLIAGVCIDLKGFKTFDGKYYINQVTHTIGSGYTTGLSIRKVLDY